MTEKIHKNLSMSCFSTCLSTNHLHFNLSRRCLSVIPSLLFFQLSAVAHVVTPTCVHAQRPGERDFLFFFFCSVRAIKRGSGALVNTEERDSTRRQQHGSARDNMISALLGPLLNTTRCSTGIIVCGERGDTEERLHASSAKWIFPSYWSA